MHSGDTQRKEKTEVADPTVQQYPVTKRLEGKVAIITGAGSSGPGMGNGKATAILFARHGARVVLVDRNLAAAEETEGIIVGEGGTATAVAADVTIPEDCQRIVRQAVDQYGRLDILHNNVGITKAGGVVEMPVEDFDLIMRVNVRSIFLMTKYAIPAMKKTGGGAIVNVASINGVVVAPAFATAYAASKAAVIAITREIAVEYAPDGIRCNAILPGFMRTPMVEQQLAGASYGDVAEMDRQRSSYVPMKRQGEGWDTAAAALFLVSDDSPYVNGAQLVVDGGLSIHIPKKEI
jgi:NAD(P)-dependent dehydrogenase (short-subunit alcohol dehydrogenase family)